MLLWSRDPQLGFTSYQWMPNCKFYDRSRNSSSGASNETWQLYLGCLQTWDCECFKSSKPYTVSKTLDEWMNVYLVVQYFFACLVKKHCASGQKIAITVAWVLAAETTLLGRGLSLYPMTFIFFYRGNKGQTSYHPVHCTRRGSDVNDVKQQHLSIVNPSSDFLN